MRSLDATIAARLSPDILLALFDAGVALGLGIAPERAASAEVQQVIDAVQTRWFGELEAARAWRRSADDPTLLRDEISGWLLAACERQAALGDAEPLVTAPIGGGR